MWSLEIGAGEIGRKQEAVEASGVKRRVHWAGDHTAGVGGGSVFSG